MRHFGLPADPAWFCIKEREKVSESDSEFPNGNNPIIKYQYLSTIYSIRLQRRLFTGAHLQFAPRPILPFWQFLSPVLHQIPLQIIRNMLQHQLANKWTLWNYYFTPHRERGPQLIQDYHKNLENVLTVQNLPQLSYFLSKSKLADLGNYFSDVENQRIPKYTYKRETRKLQAISFFKNSIEPSREYAENVNGGHFDTTITRDNRETVNSIYNSLVIQLAFQRFVYADEINGVRFVERTSPDKGEFLVRVQIWVRFNDTSQEKIDKFTQAFKEFCIEIGWFVPSIKFYNNLT